MSLFYPMVLSIILFSISCKTKESSIQNVKVANAYAADGLYREAIDSYQEALKKVGNQPVIFRNLGIVYLKSKNYKKSIKFLTLAKPSFTEDFDLHFYLGESYRALFKYEKSIYYYQKALEIRPNDTHVQNILAWNYFNIRFYEAALDLIKKSYKKDPNNIQVSTIYARVLTKTKQFKKALKVIKKSLKRKSGKQIKEYLYSLKGDIYYDQGKTKKAKKYYKKAIKVQPLMASALNGLGKVYWLEKNYKRSIKFLKRSLRIKPDFVENHYYLALSYENINQKKALMHYKKFRQLAATDAYYNDKVTTSINKIGLLSKGTTKKNNLESKEKKIIF